MQRYYVNNRSPFLDLAFIKELFKTFYCGVYSDVFTNNPVKRYKGQLIYSNIINKTYPELFNMMTGKGYKPADLFTNKGKFNLVTNLVKKKLDGSKNKSPDPFSVKRSFNYNKRSWFDISFLNEYYNKDQVIKETKNLDLIFNVISSNYYLTKNARLIFSK